MGIYIILGLAELYKATCDVTDIELAIHTALSVKERLLSSSNQHIGAVVPALEPGTRRLGDWLHFLHALTALLNAYDSEETSYLARYCVRIICERHWQPEEHMLVELLTDKFKPYPIGNNEVTGVYSWHAIQACWLVMEEALRVGHRQTYLQGVNMGISTLDRYFIEGKGLACHNSAYNRSSNPAGNRALYPWGALDDMLVYCLMVLEHQHLANVIDYYNKCFAVHQTKPEDTSGVLHTPRRFFYTIAILERMIQRGYRVSGIFQT